MLEEGLGTRKLSFRISELFILCMLFCNDLNSSEEGRSDLLQTLLCKHRNQVLRLKETLLHIQSDLAP